MRRLAGYALAAAVLAADQGIKFWVLGNTPLQSGAVLTVLPVLNFVMVWNHGITFGLFAGVASKALLAAVALVVVAVLGVWLWRCRNLAESLAIGAIAGGALGNIIDRLRDGSVTDFIKLPLGWPPFNLADASIAVGVLLLVIAIEAPRRGGRSA